MNKDEYIVYVFARYTDATSVVMGCTLDVSFALNDINKKINNDKYYCHCGYYVESLTKGEEIIDFICGLDPNIRVLSDHFLIEISAFTAHKFLKDVAAISGREDYLLEPKEAFALSRDSSISSPKIKENKQTITQSASSNKQEVPEHTSLYDENLKELHQFASSGEMNRSKVAEIFTRLGKLQKKNLIGHDKRKIHYSDLNYDKTYYTVCINKSNTRDTIYIVLDDSIKRDLYLFAIPKGCLDLSLLKQNEKFPDQYYMQILYNDPDFKEFYSSGKISLKQYLVTEPFSYWPEEEVENDILPNDDRSHFKPTHYKEEKVKAKTIDHKGLNESFDADKFTPLTITFNDSPDIETKTYQDMVDVALDAFYALTKDKLNELVLSNKIEHLSSNQYTLKNPIKASILLFDIYYEGNLDGNESLKLIRQIASELDINVDTFQMRLQRK